MSALFYPAKIPVMTIFTQVMKKASMREIELTDRAMRFLLGYWIKLKMQVFTTPTKIYRKLMLTFNFA